MSKDEFQGGVVIPSLFELDELPMCPAVIQEPAGPHGLAYSWGGSGGDGGGDGGDSGTGESGDGEGDGDGDGGGDGGGEGEGDGDGG